jgi:hypothetical protein
MERADNIYPAGAGRLEDQVRRETGYRRAAHALETRHAGIAQSQRGAVWPAGRTFDPRP